MTVCLTIMIHCAIPEVMQATQRVVLVSSEHRSHAAVGCGCAQLVQYVPVFFPQDVQQHPTKIWGLVRERHDRAFKQKLPKGRAVNRRDCKRAAKKKALTSTIVNFVVRKCNVIA